MFNNYSNYPFGFDSGLLLKDVPINLTSQSSVYWVANNSTLEQNEKIASNSNKGTFLQPFATLQYAIDACKANNINTIMVRATYAQTITAAGGLNVDVAGLKIIGVGAGEKFPTLTFGTSTAATCTITAANVTMKGFIGTNTLDQIVSPFVVSAAGVTLDLEWQDSASNVEALRAVLTTAAADNFTLNLTYKGQTGGSHCVNAVRLVGCDNGAININFNGKASTSIVEFVTTACTNITVGGYMYNSGTTDGSKDIVDTVTGSTWFGYVYDGAAGQAYSGGSGAAWGPSNASTIVADLSVPTADATTNALERDVIGNKTDAAVTAVGTTKSVLGYSKGILTNMLVPSADASTNTNARDVVGNKTDAAVYVPGTTNSLAAYAKGTSNLQERVAFKTAATMTNGQTLFTIAGGPVEIVALASVCVTGNDATASTLQYSVTPTSGSAQTISGASASLANAAAGASVTLAGTALSTAALYNANGPNLIANPGTIFAPAGTITAVIGTGSTTGTWAHYIRYRPLAVGVTVS